MAAFHLIIYGRFWVITEGTTKAVPFQDDDLFRCSLNMQVPNNTAGLDEILLNQASLWAAGCCDHRSTSTEQDCHDDVLIIVVTLQRHAER